MTTGTRLGVVAAVALAGTTYMAYSAVSSRWQYYVTVDECIRGEQALRGARIRVRGRLVAHSLQITSERTGARFRLAGSERDLSVVCSGPLPDNLAAATEVLVEGRLETDGVLRGERVLTRCASKYASRRDAGAANGDRGAAKPRENG